MPKNNELYQKLNQVGPQPGDLIDMSDPNQITVTKPGGTTFVYPLDKKGKVKPDSAYVTHKRTGS